MAVRRTGSGMSSQDDKLHRPATTPELREQQLTSLAYDLAEKQLREGTASSQTVQHFLKMGSTRERAEQERLKHEIEVLGAKVEQMATAQRIEVLIGDAMNAMRAYQGLSPLSLEDEIDDPENLY